MLMFVFYFDKGDDDDDDDDEGDARRACADVTEGLTPLTAASHGGYYEIVQMLLKHGHSVRRPHIALCECAECVRVEKTKEVCHRGTAKRTGTQG